VSGHVLHETTLRVFLVGSLLLWCQPIFAIPIEDLDPARDWQLKDLTMTGNERFSSREILGALTTKTRPWYAPWRSLPPFDPATFAADMERLVRFYQAKGYYDAKISYDLEVDETEDHVIANVTINEGEPVKVAEISFAVSDRPALMAELDTLRTGLPLTEGMIFTEESYQQTEAKIKEFFLDQGLARVKVERKAEVIRDKHEARVSYVVEAGPPTVFGETKVEGLKEVAQEIVTRELTYKVGEPFSNKALAASRKNLLELDLFSEIRFVPLESIGDPTVAPIELRVEEKPPREIKLGIGYATEEQLRAQARWRHNNWLGGGRRLDIGAKVSFIAREGNISFLQPHFLGPENRFSLTAGPQQFDEPGYLLNSVRLQPRLERKFSDNLSGFLGYRVEYDKLKDVPQATIQELKEFKREGLLSGLSLGFLWNTADDALNPTKGWTVSFLSEEVGGPLGGKFDFYKLQGETKWYYPLAAKTVFASRLKLGFAEPFNGSQEVPLFERFYAGGSNSVRGYGRRRLGPLSASDDPIGGRSLIEGAVEMRQQFTQEIGGALFLDFGQVSVRSFDVPVDDLKFAAGFGIRYTTPVGPLRFDVGFPFQPPKKDRSWQIHFSIGQFF
jgi:outer membrane protein insertion porin family